MILSLWQSRWWRALLAAAAIAVWPACSAGRSAREVPSAGSPSLDFVLKDMNGADVSLAEFKGRPVIINFWATWCPPCKEEIPWLIEFAERYKARDLVILGVSVDDTAEDIRTFAALHEVNYPMLVGDRQDDFKAAFDAEALIPVSWLIRADGTLHAKAQGIQPKAWFEEHIESLF
jgi:thiol-disulfide isomerase/thioredoxin